jgi:hypothetical protein
MKARLESPATGWMSVSFAFRESEIDALIKRLEDLKAGRVGHFHFRNDDFSGAEGVADVELSLMGVDESDNMAIE